MPDYHLILDWLQYRDPWGNSVQHWLLALGVAAAVAKTPQEAG